jgi:hypothetical protein
MPGFQTFPASLLRSAAKKRVAHVDDGFNFELRATTADDALKL